MMWQLTLVSQEAERAEIEKYLQEDEYLISLSMFNAGEDMILEQQINEIPQWSWVKIEALFQEKEQALAAQKCLEHAKLGAEFNCQALPERNWVIYGLKDFKPLVVGGLWIYPYWLLPEQAQEPFVSLDPGFAFGTGEHPTTKMCLEWLSQHDLKSKTLIDYGCGSGILGLAAVKLGAKQAFGLDIDPQACEASEQNAKRNQLSQQQLFICQNQQDLPEKVDILIANIVMNPLLELRDFFHQCLVNQGSLVLSGLLKSQAQQVIQHYQSLFECREQRFEQDWVCLVFQAKERV